MEHLQAMKELLCSFPAWGDQPLAIDTPQGKIATCSLFPLGVQVKTRQEDVLGNVRYRLRESFLLRRAACQSMEAAMWLRELQHWLLRQKPAWDVGENFHIFAENGHLVSGKQPGTGIYEVKIHVDYEKE